jgi:tetratricopeptide (TPR) repeat protein
LVVILLASAAFRAVYFHLYAGRSPFFGTPILDSEVYDEWARRIAAGEWIGSRAFYFPPLYPYLLALIYRLAGRSLELVYVVQQALGLVNIVLLYRLGLRLHGRRAGVLAAAAAALYAPLPYFETKILTTTVGLTLHLAALLLLVRAEQAPAGGASSGAARGRAAGALRDRGSGSVRDRAEGAARGPARLAPWIAAGAALGATALCLPGAILLAAVYAVVLFLREPRAAAGLAAGTFAALLPVLAHNLAAEGDPLLLSGQGGITFYQGNNPSALGLYSPVPGFSGAPEKQAEEERAIAERAAGRPLKSSGVSLHFFRRGLEFIGRSPGAWLLLQARKVGYLIGGYEASTEYSLYHERDLIGWLRLPFLPYAVLAGAGGVGLAQAIADRRRRRGGPGDRALLLFALCAAAVPLLFYVSSRYRLPLAAAFILYGAAFADRLWRGREALARRPGPLLAAIGVALVSWLPLGRPNVTAEANVHYNVGSILADRGLHEEAIAAYDRSLADFPGNAYAHINRGNSLDWLGREDEALISYRRAEEVDRDFWTAYKAQGVILYRQKRFEEAAEAYRRGLAHGGAEAQFLLGATLKRLGRADEAEAPLIEAVRLDPRHAQAHARLGEIYAARGDAGRARDHFRRALDADPDNTTARTGLERLGGASR